jgi:hypothetical protein
MYQKRGRLNLHPPIPSFEAGGWRISIFVRTGKSKVRHDVYFVEYSSKTFEYLGKEVKKLMKSTLGGRGGMRGNRDVKVRGSLPRIAPEVLYTCVIMPHFQGLIIQLLTTMFQFQGYIEIIS